MAWVDPNIAAEMAHAPEIHTAVLLQRDEIATAAKGLFAAHNNPGGHEIATIDEPVDALVSLEGPAPLSVEFGHWTPNHETHVEGLHILSRAVAQAQA